MPASYGGDGVAMCESAYQDIGVTHGEATTNQLSTSGTFIPNAVILQASAIPTVTGLNVGYKTEPEYCVRWESGATGVFTLLLYEQNGTPVGATAVPTITLVPPQANRGS